MHKQPPSDGTGISRQVENERFGRWLRQQRESYDLSQEDVARIIGVSAEHMQKWEHGSRPSDGNHIDRLLKLYAVLLDVVGSTTR